MVPLSDWFDSRPVATASQAISQVLLERLQTAQASPKDRLRSLPQLRPSRLWLKELPKLKFSSVGGNLTTSKLPDGLIDRTNPQA